MIEGLGIEIADLPRFKKAMERWGQRFLTRLFTAAELEYCMSQRRPEEHLGARYCAKVSFMKARGRIIPFKSIEIIRDVVGRPALRVAGDDKIKVAVTMSHDGDIALAQTLITTE